MVAQSNLASLDVTSWLAGAGMGHPPRESATATLAARLDLSRSGMQRGREDGQWSMAGGGMGANRSDVCSAG
jgi:hypothetical protein